MLAPTTVLAFQHLETFKRRFQPFPVRVEMFSRFRSPKELKAGLADLAEGKVDIAIGTHRLLSQDVEFRDLGLVIVDEEQRFGVKHKERLKQLKKQVDVIAMSATPIPRTLHMSLLGLRDMSVIETPPKDRLAIHTVVAPFQPELIRAALELELGRAARSTSCTIAWIPSGSELPASRNWFPMRASASAMAKWRRRSWSEPC